MRELLLSLAWLMLIIAIITFYFLSSGRVAEYGRHSTSTGSSASFSPKLAWFIQEVPSFIIPMYYCLARTSATGLYLNFFLVLHYFVRSFIFPFRIRSTTPSPLKIAIVAFFFCAYNGFLQGAWNAHYQLDQGLKFHHIFGATLFIIGFCINQKADQMLFALRDEHGKGYHIPTGFLYEYISCPNYFGEIMEWTGYAIMSWSLPAVAFAVFTAANLVPRARAHHAWYLQKFDDYPKNRGALLPNFQASE